MKKIMKITGIIVLIPVILFVVAAVGLATIDLNNYRAEIEKLVADNTGRQLALKGDLEKSFFPWLGVNVGAVALSNAKGFEPAEFASVNQVEIKIDTLSLLKLEPKISRIIVKGLKLNLAKNKEGVSNWDDLSKPSDAAEAVDKKTDDTQTDKQTPVATKPATDPLALVNVAGITIEDANVSWNDQQAGSSYAVKKLNLSVSQIALNKPVALDMDFEFSSNQPAVKAKVNLSSDKIEWDLNKQRYAVSPLNLSIQASGDVLPVSPLSAQLQLSADTNLDKQIFAVSDLKLNTLGLALQAKASVSQLMEAPNYQTDLSIAKFNPRTVLEKLKIALPVMTDNKALTAVSVSLKAKGDTSQIEISDLQLALDDSKVEASTSVKNFTKPVIKAALTLDQIDLDRYLPPSTGEEVSAPPAGDATPAATEPQPLPIPVELIRDLDVDASVKAGKLIIRQLDVTDVVVKARVKNKVATLSPVSLNVAQGSVRSDITLDVTKDTPRYRVKQSFDQVQAAPLAKAFVGDEYVGGLLMFKAAIDSQGLLVDEVKKNLNGNLSFLFKDGAVKGVNLGEMLRKAKAKLDKTEYVESQEPKQTDFAQLGGSATIKNGVVTNKDLSAKSPLLRVEGKGKVDLVAENLDYLVTTYLVGTSKGQGGKSIEDLKGIPVPIHLTGPFTNIQWDYKWSIIRDALAARLKKQTKQKVEAKKEEIKQEAKQKLDEKKEEKKEELKKKAEEKLKKLFKF